MALVVVVEDGTGLSNANSYVSTAEVDAFFEGDLWEPAAWTSADKDAAVVQATRMLDDVVLAKYGGWVGDRGSATQALEHPRANVLRVPDADLLAADEVLPFVKNAVYEIIRAIVTADPTLDNTRRGLKRVEAGEVEVEFDPSTIRDHVLPREAINAFVAYVRSPPGSARVVRV